MGMSFPSTPSDRCQRRQPLRNPPSLLRCLSPECHSHVYEVRPPLVRHTIRVQARLAAGPSCLRDLISLQAHPMHCIPTYRRADKKPIWRAYTFALASGHLKPRRPARAASNLNSRPNTRSRFLQECVARPIQG